MLERGQVRVARGDVGRVAGHQLEALTGHRGPPARRPFRSGIGLQPAHAQRQPLGVGLGDGQGVGAGVGGAELQLWPAVRQGQRDGAAAGAEVEHARRCVGRQQLQRPVDQGLGVGARVEHAGIDLQLQPVEGLGAGEVGQRLAGDAARAQGAEVRGGLGRQRVVVVGDQPGAVSGRPAEHVQQQHLRLRARQARGLGLPQRQRQCGLLRIQ